MSNIQVALPTEAAIQSKQYKWWQAALVGVAANVSSALPAGLNGDEAFYNQLRKPAVAPPDWMFPPAWLFNNITSLYAGLLVANLPRNTPGRRTFLVLEAAGWGLFASFSPLYFGLKSPVLGAAVTVADLGVTAASLGVASRINKKAAWGILPRFAWLALAGYVSVYMAVHNRDPFLNKGPWKKAA